LKGENEVELTWSAPNPGDLDLNGVVSGSDLFPIAVNWNLAVEPGDPEKCFDSNDDGTINGLDVFLIAANYHNRMDGFRVHHSTSEGGPYVEVTTSVLLVPDPPPEVCVPSMEFTHQNPAEGMNYYVVRSQREDEGLEGPDSNEASQQLVLEIVHFFEDFELPNYSWTFDGNGTGKDWWITSVRNHTPAGSRCAGIGDPDGYYYWENDSLVTPLINLSSTTNPRW
jgi:hypothetical protein